MQTKKISVIRWISVGTATWLPFIAKKLRRYSSCRIVGAEDALELRVVHQESKNDVVLLQVPSIPALASDPT